MAKTVNRNPYSVNISKQDDKFFTHSEWKGLCTNKNYFNIDQQTFEDCKNVYIDGDGLLKSRPAIKQLLNVHGLENIVDFWEFAGIQVYQTVNGETYNINFVQDDVIYTDNCSEKTKVILYDNCIYIFENDNLRRYNIKTKKIEQAKDFVYVPITKTITFGVADKLEPNNILTSSEITRYIISSSDELFSIDAVGKNVTININEQSYDIVFDQRYKDLLFTKKLSLPDNSYGNERILGFKKRHMISFSKKNTLIFTTLIKLSDNKYKYYIHYSANHLIFTSIECPDGVLGEPKISHDGTLAAVLLNDGLYVLSLFETEFDGENTYKKYPKWTNLLKDTYKVTFDDNINTYASDCIERQNIVVGLDIIDDKHFAFVYGKNPTKVDDIATIGGIVTNISLNNPSGIYPNHTLYTRLGVVIYDDDINEKFPLLASYRHYDYESASSNVKVYIGTSREQNVNIPIEYFTASDIDVQYIPFSTNAVELSLRNKNLTLSLRSFFNNEYDVFNNEHESYNNLSYYTNLLKCPYDLSGCDVSTFRFYNTSLFSEGSYDAKQIGETTVYAEVNEKLVDTYEHRIYKYTFGNNDLTTNITLIYGNQLPSSSEYFKYSKNYEAFVPYVLQTGDTPITETDASNMLSFIREYELICPAGMLIKHADYIKIVDTNRVKGYDVLISKSVDNHKVSLGFTGSILTNSNYITEDFVEMPLLFSLDLPINDYVTAGIKDGDLYTNIIYENVVTIDVKKDLSNKFVLPEQISTLSNSLYICKDHDLYVSYNKDGKLYIPENSKQSFDSDICYLHPISNNEIGIFTESGLYYSSQVTLESDVLGVAYTYNKSKVDVKCKKGMEAVTTFDGKYILFSCDKGLVAMSYQNFVASTEQTIQTLSDVIYNSYKEFNNVPIKLYQYDYWIICYSEQKDYCFVYDVRNSSFWYETYKSKPKKFDVVNDELQMLSDGKLYRFDKSDVDYDDDGEPIDWYILSQKLHLGTLNYYKNVNSIMINNVQTETLDEPVSFDLSIRNYRTGISDRYYEPLNFEYDVNLLRSYVKRCNCRKVNEFQYKLSADMETAKPKPLSINSIVIKYTLGGQLR